MTGVGKARCSHCHDTFSVPAPRRSYRVVEDAGAEGDRSQATAHPVATPALTIGLDDPSLAPRLEHTMLNTREGEPRAALAYWTDADGPRNMAASKGPPGNGDGPGPVVETVPGTVFSDESEADCACGPKQAQEACPPGEPARREVDSEVAAVMGLGLGLAAGGVLTATLGGTSWIWLPACGAAGLAGSWIVVLWKSREA